jgi:ElaB/YqjD/DUF883 family membrane-anchored ribosome-binding protein
MTKPSRDTHSALEDGSKAIRQLPGEAIDAARKTALEVREGALDLVESASDRASDITATLAKAISTTPFQAVCIAAGIGCLIGIIVARR